MTITNREAVAKINKLLNSDFDPNVYSEHWNYPDQQFATYSGLKAKQFVNKILKQFGDLAEEYLEGKGQHEVRVFIDNWAYKIFIADLIDSTTIVIFSIWKSDMTLEEATEE